MSPELGIALFSTALSVAGVAGTIFHVGRKIGSSEAKINASIEKVAEAVVTVSGKVDDLGESAKEDMASVASSNLAALNRVEASTKATIEHHETIAGMRHAEIAGRVARVEGTLDKITKVVVFSSGGHA